MFTGIIHGIAEIINIEQNQYFFTYGMQFTEFLLKDLQLGASVANNGCCLTVKYIDKNIVFFDIIHTTLRCTNFSCLKIGDEVNIERSIKFGEEVGGHLVSGHITAIAEIFKIIILENSREIWFLVKEKSIMKYILYKGFITIDGISLTINYINKNIFVINIIPETIIRTNLKNKIVGNMVNIEVDYYTRIFVDNISSMMLKYT
ncbi:MAG TPA: riboflavin synthase subunit alpha [Buchnera sp. (in: enterobacteria)]|nr:riboflavin synthase subunit alpha [Buchnera sp. (in: enterobacteria)]